MTKLLEIWGAEHWLRAGFYPLASYADTNSSLAGWTMSVPPY